MPNVSIPFNGTDQTVTRAIVLDVIDQIEDITNINKESKILFPGKDTGRMLQPGSSVDDRSRAAEYLNNHFIQIEVIEEYQKENLSTLTLARNEHLPFFYDEALGIIVKPSYATTDITINFKYRTHSKTEAKQWRDRVYMRYSQGRDLNLHELRYSYDFPKPILDLLVDVHKLREATAPYDQNFQEYFLSKASSKITNVSTLAGTNPTIMVSETQTRVIGYFDFTGAPEEEEKDTNNSSWIISFSYRFSYEKPTLCNVNYPIFIHNEFLDNKYIISNIDVNKQLPSSPYYSVSVGALENFNTSKVLDRYVDPNPILHIPEYDEFVPQIEVTSYASILFALCQIEEDLKTLLNLKELGDVVIDQDILNFMMTSEFPYMTTFNESVFYLELFSNEKVNHKNSLTIDNQLNVKAVDNLDLRVCNRVRLSILTDLSLLSDAAQSRLMKNPTALVKILSSINRALKDFPPLKLLLNTNTVSVINFNTIMHLLAGARISPSLNTIFTGLTKRDLDALSTRVKSPMNTVMNLSIIATHLSEVK